MSMSFAFCPLGQHFTRNDDAIYASRGSFNVQPYVNGFGDTDAKVFERDAHAYETVAA